MDEMMYDAFAVGDAAESGSSSSGGSSAFMTEAGQRSYYERAERGKSEGAAAPGGGGGGKAGKRPAGGAGSKLRVQLPVSCLPPQTAFPARNLVWIVYGGTGHIGRSLVKCALAHGDNVTMVGRTNETSPASIKALAENVQAAAEVVMEAAMEAGLGSSSRPAGRHRPPGRCLGTLCDVRLRETVDRVVQQTLEAFGRIDVVANCSGYGVVGACEDQDEFELRNQFETNFMGTMNILQATLPVFRHQRSARGDGALLLHDDPNDSNDRGGGDDKDDDPPNGGRYLIFSSTSGALGVPGLGPYCATKYAVEGLIEAMLYEVDAFDIKATLVEPGLVRRDDSVERQEIEDGDAQLPPPQQQQQRFKRLSSSNSSNSHDMESPPTWGHFLIKPPSEPYAGPSAPPLHAMRMVQWLGERQPTSVVQSVEIIWQLAHCKFPPLRLPLGSYAIESIRDRLRSVTEELEDWRHLHFPLPPDAAGGVSTTPGGAAATTASPAGGPKEKGEGGSAGPSAAVDDDDEMAE